MLKIIRDKTLASFGMSMILGNSDISSLFPNYIYIIQIRDDICVLLLYFGIFFLWFPIFLFQILQTVGFFSAFLANAFSNGKKNFLEFFRLEAEILTI